ncbi:MAG: hypothetical protein SGBAC_010611 [Bacillariaceae sp.]
MGTAQEPLVLSWGMQKATPYVHDYLLVFFPITEVMAAAKRHRQARQKENGIATDEDDDECLILYTFVIGAHRHSDSDSSAISTMRVVGTKDEPLELSVASLKKDISSNLPSDLIKNQDFTLLNIRENMNDGKSPSFFAWAHSEATNPINSKIGHHLFSYAAKCDLDAMLRLDFVLKVLHNELMWVPNHHVGPGPLSTASVSAEPLSTHVKVTTTPLKTDSTSVGGIVLGCLRHKAMWLNTTNDDFWRANFQNGMHLYLGGQFYIMSVNLIPGLVQEAQVQQRMPGIPTTTAGNNYMAGHEDHDVLSMVQASAVKNGQLVRWISMPRNYRFWEHPVKGETWWKRIWKREQRKATEGRLPSRNKYSLPLIATESPPSLLIVLGAKEPKDRASYREKLIAEQPDKRTCTLMDCQTTDICTGCDLVYAFVVGGNPEGPNEIVRGEEKIELDNSQASEKDLVVLNMR